jgi:hypothetical protein
VRLFGFNGARYKSHGFVTGANGRQESAMSDIPFELRVRAVGLRVSADELVRLQALVSDLDRAAQTVRGPRDYAEEPLSAFRLKPV